MSAALGKLLECSISATWVIAAILLLRVILTKAPRRVVFALWLLAAVKLLCPVSIESPLSLVPQPLAVQQRIETLVLPREVPDIQPAATEFSGTVPVQTDKPAVQSEVSEAKPEISGEAPAAPTPYSVNPLPALWAVGAAAMALYGIWSDLQLRRKLAASCLLADNIFICDYIDTPFALGIFRPRIYLPSELEETEIPYILAHERAHIRRLDPFWKLIGYGILCLHWFNPAVWLGWMFFCRDIELACDEEVIRTLDNSGKAGYSRALLRCSAPGFPAFIPPAFNKNSIKARVKAVLSYKRPGMILTALACVLLIVAAVCLLTSPTPDRVPDISDAYLMGRAAVFRCRSRRS